MRKRSDDGKDDYYFLVENAKFAILFRKLQKSKFFGEPPHRSRGHIGTSRVDPIREYSGNLRDVLNSQSQHVAEDSLANELCGRAWTFSGMESVCIEGSQVKTGCFMTFKMCWSVKHASRMTLARKYGEGIRFVFQEKSEKGKLSRVFQLSGTF